MKKHFFTGAVVGGVITAVSIFFFSPTNGDDIVDEIEVELEANKENEDEE